MKKIKVHRDALPDLRIVISEQLVSFAQEMEGVKNKKQQIKIYNEYTDKIISGIAYCFAPEYLDH